MKLFHKLNGKWLEVTSNNGGGSNSDINLPEGGSDGYLLSKLGDNLSWTNPENVGFKLPEDGNTGQVLLCDNNDENNSIGAKWGLIQAPHSMSIGDMGYTYSDNPPSNALFCGGLVSKTKYPELYSIIGDKFTNDSIYKDKLIVPEWEYAQNSTMIKNVTSDLTLGEESYYSAIIDNNIKVTTIGSNGGIHSTYYYGWYAFNTSVFPGGTGGQYLWVTPGGGWSTIEIERLDNLYFSPYEYKIKRRNVNNDGSAYYFTKWELLCYDESISSWVTLDLHEDGGPTNPSYTEVVTFKIQDYDNTKTYKKFRFRIYSPSNVQGQIDWLRIYGTKEGEDNIYNLFALPPSVEDTTGAKNYIVATSGNDRDYTYTDEERVIGTWTDGKPVYRKVINHEGPTSTTNSVSYDISNLNIDTLIRLDSIWYWSTTNNYCKTPLSNSSGCSYTNISGKTSLTSTTTMPTFINASILTTIEYTKTSD